MLEAAAAFESLKAAFDLTKTFADVASSAQFQGKLIDLQRQIIEAQGQAMKAMQTEAALTERVKELEQELVRLKGFDADAQRYPLKEVFMGAFARVGRDSDDESAPEVWLCDPCFQDKKRSILQHQGRDPRAQELKVFTCPSCRSQLRVHYSKAPGRSAE